MYHFFSQLFLHLVVSEGWTLALATAECVAQDIHSQVCGLKVPKTYLLPGGATLPREVLSPSRFK